MSPVSYMIRLIEVLERLCEQLDRIYPPPASQPKGDVRLASTTETRQTAPEPTDSDALDDWRQYGPSTGGYTMSAKEWLIWRDKHAGHER